MSSRQAITLFSIFMLAVTSACAADVEPEPELGAEFAHTPSGETIVRWNQNGFAVLTTLDSGAPARDQLVRELAMVHIAMHDAINAVDDKYDTYVLDIEDEDADPALAAAAAAHAFMLAVRPGKAAQIDAFFESDLARVTDPDRRQRSLDLGGAAADAIIAERQGDNFFDPHPPFTFGPPEPGEYQPVPPAGTNVVNTGYSSVVPFALSSASQFRAPPPPSLSSTTWRNAYNETRDVGRSDSTERTAEQSTAVLFWREQVQFSWNTIARDVATRRDKGLWKTARAFALMNMSIFDALLTTFDTKYHHTYWRPYTAIREVDDGRSDTVMDPDWLPFLNTPPHPEYNSAQAVLGTAAAYSLNKIYGKHVSFTLSTSTADPPGSTRSFPNFDKAVQESAESRIWAGIHFRFSIGSLATNQGRQVGSFIYNNFLED
jgi:hypothetical protein